MSQSGEVITREEIERFKSFSGKDWDKNDPAQVKAVTQFKDVLRKLHIASTAAAETLWSREESISQKLKILTQPAPKVPRFKGYLAVIIAPTGKYSEIVKYWIFVDGPRNSASFRIVMGIKDVGRSKPFVEHTARIQKEFALAADKIIDNQLELEQLSVWIVDSIKSFQLNYDQFCEKLQPGLEIELRRLGGAKATANDDAGDADDGDQATEAAAPENVNVAAPIVPYSVDDILKDGCFLERTEIDRLLDRLRTKQNLILQGPPGTGKTWLAKRLAFALIGKKDESKVRAVQFHPNLSYEDFVRGWRPTGEGKLSLADGVFMEAIKAASNDPSSKFVVVIEEINRGNPAQIFGELLTLLEAGKRTPNEALELCYPDADGRRRPVHIPENLYVVGTMNIADRSLALVDLALRRRFAFVGLEPTLGTAWRDWVAKECAVDPSLVADIEHRISDLNDQIAADARLGKQFRIGHSYVTPSHRLEVGYTKMWFQQVVETEIGPLLDEYWFDAPGEAQKACARLLLGW